MAYGHLWGGIGVFCGDVLPSDVGGGKLNDIINIKIISLF